MQKYKIFLLLILNFTNFGWVFHKLEIKTSKGDSNTDVG